MCSGFVSVSGWSGGGAAQSRVIGAGRARLTGGGLDCHCPVQLVRSCASRTRIPTGGLRAFAPLHWSAGLRRLPLHAHVQSSIGYCAMTISTSIDNVYDYDYDYKEMRIKIVPVQ